MIRWIGIFFLVIIAALLIWLHVSYGLPYVARVYVKQNPDALDFKWKPGIDLDPAASPISLPSTPDETRIRELFEENPLIDDLDAHLMETGAQSLIVFKNGKLLFESYQNGLEKGEAIGSFSVTKSVFSILLGRVIESGAINSIDDPLTKYVPELADRDPRFSDITLAHLIDMRSGIAFNNDVFISIFSMKTSHSFIMLLTFVKPCCATPKLIQHLASFTMAITTQI